MSDGYIYIFHDKNFLHPVNIRGTKYGGCNVLYIFVFKDGPVTMNGRICTKKLERRGVFMFARRDGHPVALDVPRVNLTLS